MTPILIGFGVAAIGGAATVIVALINRKVTLRALDAESRLKQADLRVREGELAIKQAEATAATAEKERKAEEGRTEDIRRERAELAAENKSLREGLWQQIENLKKDINRIQVDADFWRNEHQKRLEELHAAQHELAELRKQETVQKRKITSLTNQVKLLTARIAEIEKDRTAPSSVMVAVDV